MKRKAVSFILFGGTGDLTARKLVPGFADLVHRGILSKNSRIIGISRKPMTNEKYKKFLIDSVSSKDHKRHIKSLQVSYLSMDVSKKEDFKKLRDALAFCEIDGCNRVYYLATSFRLFPGIVKGLKKYGLHKVHRGFTRIAFEKPFGEDLQSSNKLDKGIHSVFNEKDIYRVDHYLAKETVRNVLTLKKGKHGKLINGRKISKVEVIVSESLGVGNRLGYYNDAGALKDMVQNHLLQVLSLIMIPGKSIHKEKIKVLGSLRVVDGEFGQYKSFSKERKKAGLPNRKTETSVELLLKSNLGEWKDVELVLKTGKKLPKKEGQVRISFKNGEKMIIHIYPKQDVEYSASKKKICKQCKFNPNSPDEYSVLLEEVVNGEKDMFATSTEVRESWKVIEKAEKLKRKKPLRIYG